VTDPAAAEPPPRRRLTRLAGVGAVAGAILWPLALADLAARAVSDARGQASGGLDPTVPIALAMVLFALAAAALERRAQADFGFLDLLGDLSIGVAAAVAVVAAAFGASGLMGPAFALLVVGSVLFGVAGLNGQRRTRWGSAFIAAGAGGLLASYIVTAAVGVGRVADVAPTVLFSLLLHAAGWAWLGVHLAVGRSRGPTEASPDGDGISD